MPIGLPEIAIVLVVLLVIVGRKRLPSMGRSLGTGMREFKEGITGQKKDDDAGPAGKLAQQLNSGAREFKDGITGEDKPEQDPVEQAPTGPEDPKDPSGDSTSRS
ncbi:MAG TPA: twin-arginine translocase TatA/TatE family subunit [Baekduia sp.]|nr:twin-arginine translocase TatA/TatE family subunit [Baekduia sp.]